MSTLQVANLHFETTGANRIEYTGNNVVRVRANGGFQLPFGTSAQRANGDVGLIRYNTDTGLVESFGGAGTWDALPAGPVFNVAYGVANAAFAKANAALANASGTFAGDLTIKGVSSIYSDPLPNGKCMITSYGGGGLTRITSANTTAGGGIVAIGREPVTVHGMPAGFYSVELWSGANGGTQTVVAANGNVGIGTSPSNFKLDISGALRCLSSSEGIQTTGDTIGRDLLAGRSNVATCIGYAGGSAMVQGTNFSLSATPDLTLQPYGGNVGVGTTTPADRLSVVGNVRMQAANTRLIGFNSTAAYQLNLSGGAAILFNTLGEGSQEIAFETHFSGNSHDERMRITKDGNVGIGTSSPTTKLDVAGIGRFLQTASPTTGAVIIRASSGDTNAGHLQFVNNSNSAQYGWIRGIAGGGIAFGSADSTERMRITSGGILGIGTNSPSYTVDAQGTGDISARFKTSSGGAELLLDATNNFNSIRLFNSGAEKWRAGQVGNANYSIYDSAAGTNRLVIDTSGRVTTPSQPAFYAVGNGGNYTITNGADIVFGSTRFNTGNHYNTTNGRFTAPIAGVYCFHWSTYVTGATGRCSFKINGGDISSQQLDYSATQSQSMTIYLNASDYVTVGDWQSISGGSLWLGHSHFSGHLVG